MIEITREEIEAKVKSDAAIAEIMNKYDPASKAAIIEIAVIISRAFNSREAAEIFVGETIANRKNHSAHSLAGTQ